MVPGRGWAAAALLALAPLLPAAPSTAADNPWQVSRTQYSGNQNYLLNAVFVPAAEDVWAVGYRHGSVGGSYEFRTVIEHSTGGSDFQLVPSPDREGAPATNFLQDIHGPSPSDLWAVGWSRNPREPSRTLIERWNGSTWSIWPSADPGPFGNILNGVVSLAADDTWAVGARQDSFYQTPMAQHWDGTAWSAVPVPNPAFCTGHSYLGDIAARSATAIWATGVCTSSSTGGDQGFVVRWNGTRWVIPSAVNAAIPGRVTLSSLSISGPVVWLVGVSSADGVAFALRNQGGGWVRVPLSAQDSRGTAFAAVVARSGGTAWAVGTAPSPQPPFAGPGAMRLNAAGGLRQTIPLSYGSLRGVAYDPAGRIWAVGTQLPGQHDLPLVVSRSVP